MTCSITTGERALLAMAHHREEDLSMMGRGSTILEFKLTWNLSESETAWPLLDPELNVVIGNEISGHVSEYASCIIICYFMVNFSFWMCTGSIAGGFLCFVGSVKVFTCTPQQLGSLPLPEFFALNKQMASLRVLSRSQVRPLLLCGSQTPAASYSPSFAAQGIEPLLFAGIFEILRIFKTPVTQGKTR